MSERKEVQIKQPVPELKKQVAPQYENFSSSKQRFDEVGMFVAEAGFVMLKGRNGRPDMIYPLEKAMKRIFSMARIYFEWMHNGFVSQCEQLREVLLEFACKFQQAMAQRIGLGMTVPKWFTPFVSDKLAKLINRLKMK